VLPQGSPGVDVSRSDTTARWLDASALRHVIMRRVTSALSILPTRNCSLYNRSFSTFSAFAIIWIRINQVFMLYTIFRYWSHRLILQNWHLSCMIRYGKIFLILHPGMQQNIYSIYLLY